MSKIIIAKSELPDLSTNLTNKLRYRIMNKNRNLFSDWSIISEIKRELEQIDFSSASSSYAAYSNEANKVEASWYTANINQNYDIYVRYILKTIKESSFVTLYSYDKIQYLGRKNVNYLTISKKPTTGLVSFNQLSYYGLQLMVKLPEYPIISSLAISINQARRKDNHLQYFLERSHLLSVGDYVNIEFNNVITTGSEIDYSFFAGIKQVSTIESASSFGVYNPGADTAFIAPPVIDGYPNTVEKINGSVVFSTPNVVFVP